MKTKYEESQEPSPKPDLLLLNTTSLRRAILEAEIVSDSRMNLNKDHWDYYDD